MKDRKIYILIFILCWITGIIGGYYLGVGSAVLPNESIDHNFFVSSNNEFETFSGNASQNSEEQKDGAESGDSEDYYPSFFRGIELNKIPQDLIKRYFGQSR